MLGASDPVILLISASGQVGSTGVLLGERSATASFRVKSNGNCAMLHQNQVLRTPFVLVLLCDVLDSRV